MKGTTRATLLLMFWAATVNNSYSGARRNAPPAEPVAASPTQTPALSFEFFKTEVQPIFLKNRTEHARCYGCHILSNRIFRLEPLSPGSTDWSDEQSRRNFQSALEVVVPGDPASSKLLLHPLSPEAGGDPFHSGGRQFASQNDPDWLVIAEWVRGVRTGISEPAPQALTRVYVTNSASDTIDVIDPATNKVVQVIRGIELPHGIAFSPDGARIYVSNEAESVLDVVDRKSGEILSKVPLSDRPNNLAITQDGSQVLVGIRKPPGVLDVIDTTSLKKVKSIPVDGAVHNVYVTPDGKYAVSGSIENKSVTVIDLDSQLMVWEVKFDRPVRPMAFETNPDGSTRRIFVQLSTFHGFAVTPDGKSLWVNSTLSNAVFKYSLPDLKLIGHAALPEVHPLGHAPTGAVPEWIAFTPDSKMVYVSDSAARLVSVIDAQTLKEVARIPVGEVPKRIKTLVLR